MSDLRDQLRTARAEYEAIAYPGDLADDVSPAPSRLQNWRRWALLTGGFGAGSLAAAAAIVISLINFLPTATQVRPGDDVIAQVTSSGGFASLSSLPERLSNLTTVIPYDKVRSTLNLLGFPVGQDDADKESTSQDRDHASA